MKKFNWLLVMLLLALVPALQSCDDDGYSIGDIGWDWATVRATGGGGYYLEGDRWGTIDPVASSIPWYKPVDGERVVAFFNPFTVNFPDSFKAFQTCPAHVPITSAFILFYV